MGTLLLPARKRRRREVAGAVSADTLASIGEAVATAAPGSGVAVSRDHPPLEELGEAPGRPGGAVYLRDRGGDLLRPSPQGCAVKLRRPGWPGTGMLWAWAQI